MLVSLMSSPESSPLLNLKSLLLLGSVVPVGSSNVLSGSLSDIQSLSPFHPFPLLFPGLFFPQARSWCAKIPVPALQFAALESQFRVEPFIFIQKKEKQKKKEREREGSKSYFI